MELKFEINFNDFVEYNLYLRRKNIYDRIFTIIYTLFCIGAAIYGIYYKYYTLTIICLLLSATFQKIKKFTVKYYAKKMIDNKYATLGQVIIKLDEDCYYVEQCGLKTEADYHKITRLYEDKNYIYVHIGIPAISIPLKTFTNIEQKHKFIRFINEKRLLKTMFPENPMITVNDISEALRKPNFIIYSIDKQVKIFGKKFLKLKLQINTDINIYDILDKLNNYIYDLSDCRDKLVSFYLDNFYDYMDTNELMFTWYDTLDINEGIITCDKNTEFSADFLIGDNLISEYDLTVKFKGNKITDMYFRQ